MISYILFDLDNTLYRASSGFAQAISDKMTQFAADTLGVDFEKARALRKINAPKYGTTMEWLRQKHGFSDVDHFFDYVHPKEVDRFLSPNPELRDMLERTPLPKSILTNGPIEHARRVLDYLGITDLFNHIFDIRLNNLEGKPAESAYNRALGEIGKTPSQVLFIDDLLRYLIPFRDMGGNTLLVDENGRFDNENHGIRTIRHISELPVVLEEFL